MEVIDPEERYARAQVAAAIDAYHRRQAFVDSRRTVPMFERDEPKPARTWTDLAAAWLIFALALAGLVMLVFWPLKQ